MNSDEFAQKIKDKYPAYANMSNPELVRKTLEKHPAYRNQITEEAPQSTGSMAWEATKGALSTPIPVAGRAVEAVRNDIPNLISEKSGQLGQKVGGLPGEAIKDVGLAVGTTAGTVGEMLPKTVGEGAAIGLAGPVMEGAGNIVKPITKKLIPAAGDMLADFAGAWTGKDPEYIKAVFKKPEIMKKVSQAIGMDVQKSAVDAINPGKQKLGKLVGALQDSFAQFGKEATSGKAPMVETTKALKGVASQLESMGHRVPKE